MGNIEDSSTQPTSPHPPPSSTLITTIRTLQETGLSVVPLADACAACEDPCDLGSYPRKFDIDFESEMLGSTKGYARQVRSCFLSVFRSFFLFISFFRILLARMGCVS